MEYVKWNNDNIPQIAVIEMSTQGNLFNVKCEIDLHPDIGQTESEYLNKWMGSQDTKSIIVTNKSENDKHYFFKNCKVIFIYYGADSKITTCKLKATEILEITRELKINKILK
jgi:hypothetical protein